jgi:sodium transport system permease protein
VLSCVSFLPGQLLLRSETLSAVFRFGMREASYFIALLLPLAGALSALLMAIAIRCKSFKEAQANATVVMLAVSLVPMVALFNLQGPAAWHQWVPALAQTTLMGRVLKGESVSGVEALPSLLVCIVLGALALMFVARTLRAAAVK